MLPVYLLSSSLLPGTRSLPMLETRYLPVTLPPCDALLLTSKNGVEALKRSGPWPSLPAFAVGDATARAVREAGGQVACAANGYGEELADAILGDPALTRLRFCYLRAKEVSTDLAALLRARGVAVEERTVYETQCSGEPLEAPDPEAVILFSAPSHVRCFLARFGWREGWRAVCIGEKTAAALPPEIPHMVSPERSLEAAVRFAQGHFIAS